MGQILAAGSWEKISRTNSRSQYGSRDLPILGRGQRSTFREWSECPQPMQMVDNRREIRNISSTWWSQMGREKNLTQLCHPQVKRILNSQRGLLVTTALHLSVCQVLLLQGTGCSTPGEQVSFWNSLFLLSGNSPKLSSKIYLLFPEPEFLLFVEREFTHLGGVHSPGASWEGDILRT